MAMNEYTVTNLIDALEDGDIDTVKEIIKADKSLLVRQSNNIECECKKCLRNLPINILLFGHNYDFSFNVQFVRELFDEGILNHTDFPDSSLYSMVLHGGGNEERLDLFLSNVPVERWLTVGDYHYTRRDEKYNILWAVCTSSMTQEQLNRYFTIFLEMGISPLTPESPSPVVFLVHFCQLELLKKVAEKYPLPINEVDKHGNTALMRMLSCHIRSHNLHEIELCREMIQYVLLQDHENFHTTHVSNKMFNIYDFIHTYGWTVALQDILPIPEGELVSDDAKI